MKKLTALLLLCLMLGGCADKIVATATDPTPEPAPAQNPSGTEKTREPVSDLSQNYESRFSSETRIILSDDGIATDGEGVSISHDIVYYEDRDAYGSGNPYGEGEAWERHTAQEAQAHTVVNLTAPGAYRVSGKLSAGQIRVDLGEDACDDPEAVVELILDGADITCTVAPAIVFLNVYECDAERSQETASPEVDTTDAGANLILAGENTVTGSHVARIYRDSDGEKKLWKQDGAIYSYMSMNVFGPGALTLTGDNEGLDTERHLTIHSGDLTIFSDNDGINTNEDGVSVTTVSGGRVRIAAGLGEEGDGIDSNGYLVVNGGTVVSSAHPASDGGLDSDLGTYIHGGTVIALGASRNWAESGSEQVTMNLQFAGYQEGNSALVVEAEDGSVVFAYDPSLDEALVENQRRYQGAVISCPAVREGETYRLYSGGDLTGEETGGLYSSVSSYQGGTRLRCTGTDADRNPGSFRPEGMEPPEGFEKPERGERPDGQHPEGGEGLDGQRPEKPEGFDGQPPENGFSTPEESGSSADSPTDFYIRDKVNTFSGIAAVDESK